MAIVLVKRLRRTGVCEDMAYHIHVGATAWNAWCRFRHAAQSPLLQASNIRFPDKFVRTSNSTTNTPCRVGVDMTELTMVATIVVPSNVLVAPSTVLVALDYHLYDDLRKVAMWLDLRRWNEGAWSTTTRISSYSRAECPGRTLTLRSRQRASGQDSPKAHTGRCVDAPNHAVDDALGLARRKT
ncbi:hypothetical protein H310_10323 [Aphanomyces invadans]|uniref:Uncharacterized protein n=1 Tax=Aphanomyces invadans TaxID=157072 RepID=A0A024TRJ6_9STRA|nr:hypothetical protein H310_10323 [Aphanomyces invadans]ETV96629.1 hypothetical protein H310_10323 [Aphanomyces invadans]|eukprot:XP_008874892.1 hypothetical protein H310_10323 [Aphanomyces invadans]